HRDLAGEGPRIRCDQDGSGCGGRRENDHRQKRSRAIVAVYHSDREQCEEALHSQARPFDPIDRRVAEYDALPACIERFFQRADGLTLRDRLSLTLWYLVEGELPCFGRGPRDRRERGGALRHGIPLMSRGFLNLATHERPHLSLGWLWKACGQQNDRTERARLPVDGVVGLP